MSSGKVVIFFVFLIVASIAMYYNVKNMQHAAKRVEYAQEDLKAAYQDCVTATEHLNQIELRNGMALSPNPCPPP